MWIWFLQPLHFPCVCIYSLYLFSKFHLVVVQHNGSFGGESLSPNQCGKGRAGRRQGRRFMQSFRFCADGRHTLILNDEVVSSSEAAELKTPLWLRMVQGKHTVVVWRRDFRRDTPMFQAVTGSESHIPVLPNTDRHDGTMQLQCLRVATVVESQRRLMLSAAPMVTHGRGASVGPSCAAYLSHCQAASGWNPMHMLLYGQKETSSVQSSFKAWHEHTAGCWPKCAH